MSARRTAAESVVLRIGEVAKLTGLTTRTLRYWEELGLISPSGYRGRGERLYSPTDMARASRIKELQDLLGFSLAEVRMVLDTEDVDVLDRVRSEYRRGNPSPARRKHLLEEAIDANDRLLDRLDDTLRRIGAFREERAVKATSLRQARAELESGGAITEDTASRPAVPVGTRARRRVPSRASVGSSKATTRRS